MNKLDLGAVTAYAMAVEQGYEGTEEEFAALQANSGNNALRAENAADRAQQILESIPLDFQEVSQGVATLTEEMIDYNALDISLLPGVDARTSRVDGGVSFTWDENRKSLCHVEGTRSEPTSPFVNLISSTSSLPEPIKAGKTYYLHFSATDPNIVARIYRYTGSNYTWDEYTQSTIVKLDADATGIILRIATVVEDGETVNGDAEIALLSNAPNSFLTNAGMLTAPDDIQRTIVMVDNATDDIFPHQTAFWENGNTANPADKTRLRSDFIPIQNVVSLRVENGSSGNVGMYIELYKGSEGAYVYDTDTGTRFIDTVYDIAPGYTAIRFVIRWFDGAKPISPDDLLSASYNIHVYPNFGVSPCRVRVMQYNLGGFNRGFNHDSASGIDQSTLPEVIAAYKRFFGTNKADILCMEEFTEYIDKADTEYPTKATLFDGIYHATTQRDYGNAISTQYPILYEKWLYLSEGDETGAILYTAVCNIEGRTTLVVGGNLRVLAAEATRRSAFAQLMEETARYDYVIIGMDVNPLSQDEFDYYVSTANNAGYSIANGGYFGAIPTLLSTGDFKAIDNIFVKGGKIVNVEVPDVGDTLASDHLPILADVLLY